MINRNHHIYKIIIGIFIAGTTLSGISCVEQKENTTLPGYNLNAPVKYNMAQSLFEISGIAFNNGNAKQVFAIQDEDGDLFQFGLKDKNVKSTKFAGKGDYEDLAICNGQVIILRSDGQLYTFPLNETSKAEVENVLKQKDLLPKGEYEGLYADEKTSQIFILSKNSKTDQENKQTGVFIFNLSPQGTLAAQSSVNISHREIEQMAGEKITKFHPSALAKNTATNEWFILSSVNKLLVVADANWKIKAAYHLNSNIFNQPEGIAFDREHNLYISNEGGDLAAGNILFFKYKHP
ncbi:MAG: SdiA-regulated domain-containing protein [Janthinobacterium lividum]